MQHSTVSEVRPRLLRQCLALPVYCVALIFDLLSAGLTTLAAKIAGDPP
jgi:hypothetical protein